MTFKNLFPHLYDISGAGAAAAAEEPPTPTPLFGDFKLPITYTTTYPIPKNVATDLELIKLTTDISENTSEIREPIYNHLLSPAHTFASELVPKIAEAGFTDDIKYLTDTQTILTCEHTLRATVSPSPSPDDVLQIWHDVKEDASFLERYGYMDWSILEKLNTSSRFLDFLSIFNILSPMISLILPFILLIIPFFILKIRGIPITVGVYMEILHDIAKNHFLGKTFKQIASQMTFDRFLYLLASLFLYVMQTYQNVICCIRFFRNIRKIRESLITYREFARVQIAHMKHWEEKIIPLCGGGGAYTKFCEDMKIQRERLVGFLKELESIQYNSPFLGNMMRCFYLLHKNEDYEASLRYAMGFEGYLSCLEGIRENMAAKYINCGVFIDPSAVVAAATEPDSDADDAVEKTPPPPPPDLTFKGLYYPALKYSEPIKNDVEFENNFIITGPNASGKTTILKSTILNVIFMQQFGVGFFDQCTIKPYTHIHSYLNIPDTSARESLFQAETARCKQIIDCIAELPTARHFCIFDELFSGTNPYESTKTAQAFLIYLARRKERITFMMTTHYTDLCDYVVNRNASIKNWYMKTRETEGGEIEYLYTIDRGISRVQGAVKVLRAMNYPEEILNECCEEGAPAAAAPAAAADIETEKIDIE